MKFIKDLLYKGTLERIQADLKENKESVVKLKKEINNLKELISALDNDTLKKQMIPFIREYYSENMKTLMKQEDNEVYYLNKEMGGLLRDNAQLVRQIEWAEKKIMRNEKFVGVYIYRAAVVQK